MVAENQVRAVHQVGGNHRAVYNIGSLVRYVKTV